MKRAMTLKTRFILTSYCSIVISVFLICIVSYVLLGNLSRMVFPVNSWVKLILTGVVMGPLALALNFLIILRKEEREMVIGMVKSKLKGVR